MKPEEQVIASYLVSFVTLIFLITIVVGCTYSITMVHTEGNAQDVVDEQQSPTADIKATIPLK